MKNILQLFILFFKISCFCPGGGATMLPLLINDLCEKRQWYSLDEIAEGYALAQSLPGPIATNVAVYFGVRRAGIKGALAAAMGAMIPAIVSIILVIWLLDLFEFEKALALALNGIKSASIALICCSAYTMIKRSIKKPSEYILFVGLLIFTLILDVAAYFTVIIAAVTGCLAFAIGRVKENK